MKKDSPNIVFIIGSPRSGTSILSEILSTHRSIDERYEPYFVWDRHFRSAPDDQRTEADCTPEVHKQIYHDFVRYQKKTKSTLIIDKSPRNSLKIPLILKIFPDSRFIHILRDGRDTTLSINKKWKRFNSALGKGDDHSGFRFFKAFKILKKFLKYQKYLTYMIRALYHETHWHIDKSKYLNRLRWDNKPGFGPRFRNWRDIYHNSSLLEFNAYQWLKCVESIQQNRHKIPEKNFLEVRYEDLITQPRDVLSRVFDFLGIEIIGEFFKSLPKLRAANYNKWKEEFTGEQLKQILPVIEDKLNELGYAVE